MFSWSCSLSAQPPHSICSDTIRRCSDWIWYHTLVSHQELRGDCFYISSSQELKDSTSEPFVTAVEHHVCLETTFLRCFLNRKDCDRASISTDRCHLTLCKRRCRRGWKNSNFSLKPTWQGEICDAFALMVEVWGEKERKGFLKKCCWPSLQEQAVPSASISLVSSKQTNPDNLSPFFYSFHCVTLTFTKPDSHSCHYFWGSELCRWWENGVIFIPGSGWCDFGAAWR